MSSRGWFRDPGLIGVIVVTAAAILAIVTMAASRLLLPAERAWISSGDWPWTADGVVVQPLSAAGPFRTGDVVVAIDGRPLTAWVGDAIAPPWLLGGRPLPPVMSVDVLRGGGNLTLAVPIEPFPADRLGAAPLGLVVFAVTGLLLAFVLLVRRPGALALRLIVLGVTCDVADIVAWETGLQPTDFVARTPFLYAFGLAAVFGVVFWSSLAHLLSVYPVRARWVVRRPRAVAWLYVVPLAVLGAGAAIAGVAGGGPLLWLDRLGPLTAATASALGVIVLASIVAGYRRTPLPRRRQVRLLAWTLFVAVAATLALVSLPIALSRPPIVARGTVALFALPVVAALVLAVVRDHLFQVDLIRTSRTRIVAAREEERLRLRRELHDSLGPTLAALGLRVDAARERVVAGDPAAAAEILDEIRGDVRGVLAQIRALARELRPPSLDSLGLVGALRQQVEAMTGASGPSVAFVADIPSAIPAGVEVAAYRISVEAVSNVVRHAGAARATVRLTVDRDMLRIDVEDEGVGFDRGSIGVGTRTMYERAAEVGGELTIERGRDGGTHVVALLPLGGAEVSRSRVDQGAGTPVDRRGAVIEGVE